MDIKRDSIYNGLLELEKHFSASDTIIIHDGNRPLISQKTISEGLSVFSNFGSAVAFIPCTEVVFLSDDNITPNDEIPREKLMRTQTPHIFNLGKLLRGYERAETENKKYSAACSLMKDLNEKIALFSGSEINMKITTIEDLDIFRALITLPERKDLFRGMMTLM